MKRLEDHPDLFPAQARQIVLAQLGEGDAVDSDRSGGRPVESGDQPEEGRFAAPGRADHGKELLGRERKDRFRLKW
ncbi:MAG: hypothetical protein MPW15_18265 [Candidatus Manganitrophus sp.]|nr:hypothetical protein [Candidatus Manganitrophus sp.]